jgi:squalene-associated FAD-dependent desaturase
MRGVAVKGDATKRVAVVGGGWAGLSAAVRLAEAGIACTIFEASRTLGGRARRVPWIAADGREIALDNGQHILIGAYRETLVLLQRLEIDLARAFERTPLHLVSAKGLALRASRARAPWHLVAMILTARGLSFDERWAIASFMRRAKRIGWRLDADVTVEALTRDWRQPPTLTHKLWEPLCVAALNTPLPIASAQVFLNVLRDSLGAANTDSDLLLPRVDLGSLLPDAVEALFVRREHAASSIRRATRIQNIGLDEDGVALAAGSATEVGAAERFDAAVLAVPPVDAARLLASPALRDARFRPRVAACEAFVFQPIVTAYLRYRDPLGWPDRMLALDYAPHVGHHAQWVFDRSERLEADVHHARPGSGRGLAAAVISADGPHRLLDNDALVAAIGKQLATECGLASQPLESRVIVEKRATFACVPSLVRPDVRTPHPRLVLAGDYVSEPDAERHYPATIEAAVIAGRRAADRLIALFDA